MTSVLSNRLCISCGEIFPRQKIMIHYNECFKKYSKEKPQLDEKLGNSNLPQDLKEQDILEKKTYPTEAFVDYESIEREECPICSRKFAKDAIERHINSCQKINSKKPRKVYDSQKHRLQGTDAAQFKPKHSSATMDSSTTSPTKDTKKPTKSSKSKINPTFEPSSENKFASGKVDDGLVECPSCARRFNSESAERHIPHCIEQQRLSVHKNQDAQKNELLKKRLQYKPPSPAKKELEPKSQIFCGNCGAGNEMSKKFCTNCGYKHQ
eukprot:NODE_638_length_5124_cov_1.416119.p4 type:complete len:267 gc:universal NODE_638_length_5124_cov_1.416119:3251-2451(-)